MLMREIVDLLGGVSRWPSRAPPRHGSFRGQLPACRRLCPRSCRPGLAHCSSERPPFCIIHLSTRRHAFDLYAGGDLPLLASFGAGSEPIKGGLCVLSQGVTIGVNIIDINIGILFATAGQHVRARGRRMSISTGPKRPAATPADYTIQLQVHAVGGCGTFTSC